MEVKIKKEISYIESIDKWCVGIESTEPYNIWTGGHFHKDKRVAEARAEKAFKHAYDSFADAAKTKETMETVETTLEV